MSIKNHRSYGLHILHQMHRRVDTKKRRFIIVQKTKIYERTWCPIMGLLCLTYMCYKHENQQGCRYLPLGNKGAHKLQNVAK